MMHLKLGYLKASLQIYFLWINAPLEATKFEKVYLKWTKP